MTLPSLTMNETRPPPRPPEVLIKSPTKVQQRQISPLSSLDHKISINSPFSKPTPIHSNTSMDRRNEYAMRGRADSVESTRGALFGNSAVKKISPKKKQSHRKDDNTTIHQNPTKTPMHRTHIQIGNQPDHKHDNSEELLKPGKNYGSSLQSDVPILVIPSKEMLIPSSHHPKQPNYPIDDEVYLESRNHNDVIHTKIVKHHPSMHIHSHDNISLETDDFSYQENHDQNRKLIADSPRAKTVLGGTWKDRIINIVHTIFWDPIHDPEFSTVQQNTWAILLGIFMGVFTAKWGDVIEFCVYFVWVTIPEKLIEWGFFCSDLRDCKAIPLPHYLWMCPTLFGGLLAYISSILPNPIPSQNDWIDDLHRFGIIDHKTLLPLLLISTAGMASGLSLGPELPLVLSSGMVGSYVALKTKQSILSARVINLTAGAGAIGGFFGFPMAGALFILELPHRMGLQYFEALSPATISSIFAVLVNRMVTGDDIKGYFNYPYLTKTLPNHIFYIAIVYGAVGSIIGLIYVKACLSLKTHVHHWVDTSSNHEEISSPLSSESYGTETNFIGSETYNGHHVPLVGSRRNLKSSFFVIYDTYLIKPFAASKKIVEKFITAELKPTRAAIAGSFCGFCVGLICMFVPHALFWGEAQLQTIIDRGRTPLPVLGSGTTITITAYGICLIDPEDPVARTEGFGIGCAALLTVSKVLTVALSLSTGIVGGQFWGPLFVGCAASHFFTDLMAICKEFIGIGEILSAYPCVAILCVMGSVHTVTFRAHMAIMLILTLTVSAFSPGGGSSSSEGGGDYSAIFPLLVVACYVPLMLTRSLRYYGSQHCRGDIIAIPAVLCEPKKFGTAAFLVPETCYENNYEDYYSENDSSCSECESQSFDIGDSEITGETNHVMSPNIACTQDELSVAAIEQQFNEQLHAGLQTAINYGSINSWDQGPKSPELSAGNRNQDTDQGRHRRTGSDKSNGSYIFRDRRSRDNSAERGDQSQERSTEQLSLVRSFGEVDTFQPCLLTQARERGSSVGRSFTPMNGIPVHPKQQQKQTRQRSSSQVSLITVADCSITQGGLSLEDSERGWNSVSS